MGDGPYNKLEFWVPKSTFREKKASSQYNNVNARGNVLCLHVSNLKKYNLKLTQELLYNCDGILYIYTMCQISEGHPKFINSWKKRRILCNLEHIIKISHVSVRLYNMLRQND